MERQHTSEISTPIAESEPIADPDRLDSQRQEVDRLLQAADEIFDSINAIDAEEYLLRNRQTGGQ